MLCPKCRSEITAPARRCASCGYDFGEALYEKFLSYFSWKDELERLTELQNSLYAGVANVSAKIQRYKDILTRDLEQAAETLSPADAADDPKKRR